MAKAQDNLIQLKNKETGEVYWTSKNRKLVTRKIELKKYSKKLRKHITFKETKKQFQKITGKTSDFLLHQVNALEWMKGK